ncbi:MAG: CotH kinase family protein [Bacteroidaceae bacterium]|nr:CotH kinase family protein [Bacteroidaceae bacterium]
MKKRLILFLLLTIVATFGYGQGGEYVQKTNIPTIYIETDGSEPVTSKTEYIKATMIYVSGADTVRYNSMKIRGRGNSTWGLAKKPYRIKFNESTKFLGKGYAKNKSWTLLANHGDKSFLRNAVTSKMGEFLGLPFNPAAHFVDLVLNGVYLGNYQVSDQVNVDDKRVEVFEQDYVASDTSNITGGYLLEIDGFASSEPVYITTGRKLLVTVKSPDEDCINEAQKSYIRNHLNELENRLFSSSFTDSLTGYRSMIDSATVIPWYIATELSANVDGFWSTYIYKEKDDPKIYFGPLWDYDIAYNNCKRTGDVTDASMVDKGFGDGLTKVWVKQLIRDPWFNKAVNDAWKMKTSEGLESCLHHYIDSMASLINESQKLNYSRYSISSRAYDEIYLYSTYDEYVNQLKDFITEHALFLTTLFANRAGDSGNGGDGDGGDGGDGDGGDNTVVLQPFEQNNAYYYRVYNKGNNKVLDVVEGTDGGKNIVINSPAYGKDTQLWRIEKVGDYYRLVNRAEEMAFNDPSPANTVDTQLNLAEIADGDERQLWNLVVVNENGNYNIINLATDFVINNRSGYSNDGNPVISYYNDDRNSVSNNRQWRIVPEELIPDYIPDEVKEMLAATIAEAEAFLSSLADWQIGDAPFRYSAVNIEQLRGSVAASRNFESTVADDYILQNVNLAAALSAAQKVNEPVATQQYVLKHRNSGYVLNLTSQRASINSYDSESPEQHFVFEKSEVENRYYLKSVNGLYLSLGTSDSWNMYGYDGVYDSARAGLTFVAKEGYYRINAKNGLLGTTYLEADSNVYGDKMEMNLGISAYCDWLLEERDAATDKLLQEKAALLAALLYEATGLLEGIPASWIGEAPLQTSPLYAEALEDAIADMEHAVYTTVEEYEDAIERLEQTVENVQRLNAPQYDKLYNLCHSSGLNLSAANGLTLEVADLDDVEQQFSLIAVDGEPNCYNILGSNGYLSVENEESGTFMFADTPRGEYGRFVVRQVGDLLFSLSGSFGLVGVQNAYVGENVMPSVHPDGDNVQWALVEVEDGVSTGIAGYKQNVDYAVRYDRARQVVGFVSFDLLAMAGVDVHIYTVGGRLLYTFKATGEQSLADVPTGTYLVQWNWNGRQHTVKLRKE